MRRGSRFLRAAALTVAALLLPSEAHAHLALRRSSPDSGAVLERPPTAIRLWFTQPPELARSRVTLTGPGGPVAIGALAADTGNVISAVVPTLGPGGYVIRWQTASADGHPIRGQIAFTVAGAPAVAATGSTPADTTPAAPHVHEPSNEEHRSHEGYRSARWLEFAALLAILGVIGFHHLVLPAVASRGVPAAAAFDRARRIGQMALAPYLVAVLIRLWTEWQLMRDMGGDASLRALLLDTTWGRGWLAGLAGALLVLAGWRLASARRAGSTTLAAIGGVAMAVSPALTGHAAAASPMFVNVALDASHVLTVGLWVGVLFIMLVAGIPAMLRAPNGAGHAAIATMVNSFHPVALVAAPFVLFSGGASAWLRLGGYGAVLTSAYGRVLAVKVLLVLCVMALGAHNSARARRRLGSPDATRTFRVTAWSELLIAAIVLAVTTILIVTPPPAVP